MEQRDVANLEITKLDLNPKKRLMCLMFCVEIIKIANPWVLWVYDLKYVSSEKLKESGVW